MNALRIAAAASLLALAACAAGTSDSESSSAAVTGAASISSAHRTCGTVRSFVDGHGAALVYSSDGTYERVVTSGAYCESNETTQPYFVQSSDDESCFVGYVCVNAGSLGG